MAMLLGLAHAHPIQQIDIVPEVGPGKWKLNWRMDAGSAIPEIREDPTATPPSRTQLMAFTREQFARMRRTAEEYLRENLFLTMNDEPVEWSLEFPNFASDPPSFPNGAEVYPFVDIVVTGVNVPAAGGPLVALWKNDECDLFVTEGTGAAATLTVITAGDSTPMTQVPPAAAGEDGNATNNPGGQAGAGADGGQAARPADGQAGGGAAVAAPTAGGKAGSSFWRWIRYGFEHIIPKGLDHILFILGLFLLAPSMRPLLAQSLTFTLAHSVTLFLTILGVINLNERFVESAILLSIAVVAVENILRKPASLTDKLPRGRLAVVFGFGLLHGMGFASVLRALPLPPSNIIFPVIAFNVGIEIAQVAILSAAWIALAWFHRKAGAWRMVRISGSLLILLGLAWMASAMLAKS